MMGFVDKIFGNKPKSFGRMLVHSSKLNVGDMLSLDNRFALSCLTDIRDFRPGASQSS
ncbi:MAG: hypothetical protein LPD71_02285 [Shewanella sp.]|nr:hypothetical protein [Shewanella sp.]MCF1429529.1 hypothetical protein [Shewanella sp.]MCF1437604.1 hypothetical protein [Shewanella sp.]MCF1457713.1 hypothetical protein [Shewanella sp.]